MFLAGRQMEPVKILDRCCLSVIDDDLRFNLGKIFSGLLFSPLKMDLAFDHLSQMTNSQNSNIENIKIVNNDKNNSRNSSEIEISGELIVHMEMNSPSLFARRMCRRESTKFGGMTKEQEAYSRVVDKVLDSRSHKLFQQPSIVDMTRHPQLPLLFLICEKTLSVMSCSTMAVINDFTPSDVGALTSLKIDPQGGKVLLLDQKQVLIVLKIRDFGRSISEIARVRKRQISDSAFISPGCQAILTVPDGLLLLSFIGTRLEYCARYEKRDFTATWGARIWSETLGAAFKAHAQTKQNAEKIRRDLQNKPSFQKPPSFSHARLRISNSLNVLVVITEHARQILFYSTKANSQSASLTHHNIKLLGVLYLPEDSRLISDCLSLDERFLYIANRAGRILKIDISKREVVEESEDVIRTGSKNKIVGMVQFGKFLLLLNDHNVLSMICF